MKGTEALTDEEMCNLGDLGHCYISPIIPHFLSFALDSVLISQDSIRDYLEGPWRWGAEATAWVLAGKPDYDEDHAPSLLMLNKIEEDKDKKGDFDEDDIVDALKNDYQARHRGTRDPWGDPWGDRFTKNRQEFTDDFVKRGIALGVDATRINDMVVLSGLL